VDCGFDEFQILALRRNLNNSRTQLVARSNPFHPFQMALARIGTDVHWYEPFYPLVVFPVHCEIFSVRDR
jgi:hypothetical protein